MQIVEWIQRHALGAMIVSFALGASAATLVLGVPKLWSAEAAGWASALGAIGAVVVALGLATAAQRLQRKERLAAGRLAFISLWPRLHRAQAAVSSIAFRLQGAEVALKGAAQEALGRDIDILERELGMIGTSTDKLDAQRALRLVGGVALAGYVARQARRLIETGGLTERASLWKTCSESWIKDAQSATGILLSLTSESKDEASLALGTNLPHRAKRG
ncbi:TPA: hypothetical protein ACGCGV_004659 [Stenotrophomonas maltophilia]